MAQRSLIARHMPSNRRLEIIEIQNAHLAEGVVAVLICSDDALPSLVVLARGLLHLARFRTHPNISSV